jgi:hypothetical protein
MIEIAVHHLNELPELDEYVSESPTSLIYGTSHFIGLISKHLDATAYWIIARNQQGIRAVLPAVYRDGPAGGVLNSLPYYGSNGGIIQVEVDEVAKAKVIEHFYRFAEDLGCVSATIITNPLLQDSGFYEEHTKFDLRDQRIGQFTPLSSVKHPDDLMSIFDDPRPRNIRRAIKEGVRVASDHSQESLNFLYETHFANITAIGGLPKERSFFDDLLEILPKNTWTIYTAYLDEARIAALLVMYFNNTVEYFTPAVVESFRSVQPLSLIIYKAMQDFMGMGYSNWNWGGTWLSQTGVYDFKKRWGTKDLPYYYYTRLFNRQILKSSKEELSRNYKGFFVLPYSSLEG